MLQSFTLEKRNGDNVIVSKIVESLCDTGMCKINYMEKTNNWRALAVVFDKLRYLHVTTLILI